MTSSEPIETLNDDGVETNSEKLVLRRVNGNSSETDLPDMVQQKPRVASFQVGWVQVIEELQWKLNSVSDRVLFSNVLTFLFTLGALLTCDPDYGNVIIRLN